MERHVQDLEKDQLCRRCRKSRIAEEKGAGNEFQELPPKKVHKKDILCPVEGCDRRYSSKIALRYHTRTNHLIEEQEEIIDE